MDRSDISLLMQVSRGNADAFSVLVDRYLDLVSRTAFRILCERDGSEGVTVKVFESLWHDVLDYDDSFTLARWLLRKTFILSRIRIARCRILRIFGVTSSTFVNASPKVEDSDDYQTKQAWELYCRANAHMSPVQAAVYALSVLEGMDVGSVSKITGLSAVRVNSASRRAKYKVVYELRKFGRGEDYDIYIGFLRKVAESITDKNKLRNTIFTHLGLLD